MANVHIAGAQHYVCGEDIVGSGVGVPPPLALPLGARRFWRSCDLGVCDNAVVATERGELVGFFRYSWDGPRSAELVACGTWVATTHRGRGLAARMWRRVLNAFYIESVYVITATDGGTGLVEKIRREYPKLKWEGFDD